MNTSQKISISLPPDIIKYAEAYASEHKLSSRSEFFVEAVKALRERELTEGYKALALEYAVHPERFKPFEDNVDGLEPSDGSQWL